MTFLLSFSGPALSAPNGTSSFGSTFAFGMFDGTGFNPLLTTDPNGNTFTVDVNLDGTTTPTLFRAGGQSGPVASLIVPNIPEPASGFLAIFGLAGILYICAGALS